MRLSSAVRPSIAFRQNRLKDENEYVGRGWGCGKSWSGCKGKEKGTRKRMLFAERENLGLEMMRVGGWG